MQRLVEGTQAESSGPREVSGEAEGHAERRQSASAGPPRSPQELSFAHQAVGGHGRSEQASDEIWYSCSSNHSGCHCLSVTPGLCDLGQVT